MIVKKKTLQSCKGPLLPRGVNTPFLPLTAMPDAALTLLHGAVMYSCVPGTSGDTLLQPHRAGWVAQWCSSDSGCGGNGNGAVMATEVGVAAAA